MIAQWALYFSAILSKTVVILPRKFSMHTILHKIEDIVNSG